MCDTWLVIIVDNAEHHNGWVVDAKLGKFTLDINLNACIYFWDLENILSPSVELNLLDSPSPRDSSGVILDTGHGWLTCWKESIWYHGNSVKNVENCWGIEFSVYGGRILGVFTIITQNLHANMGGILINRIVLSWNCPDLYFWSRARRTTPYI